MVKICGITTRADAVAAVEAGASALGFNFCPRSPRYINPERAAEISGGLHVLKVGVFVDESPASVAEIVRVAGMDIAQLHGLENPAEYSALRIWKAHRISDTMPALEAAEAFLLDGPAPGTGTAFDWSLARNLTGRIILAGGLDPDNVAGAIREVRPWGVDACSRLERSPGIKDHERVQRFIQAALSVVL